VAEGPDDSAAASRLAGMTGDDWVLAHGVLLADDHPLRGTIVHNPRSNMNNGVGYARPIRFSQPVALGTDGIGGNVVEEFRLAYALQREGDVTATPETAWRWLENGRHLVPEAATDEVVWSYEPMSPWHVAFTPGIRPLEVRVGGEVVYSDGRPTRVEAAEVRAKAAEQAVRLHRLL
jgi:hypothetical protein